MLRDFYAILQIAPDAEQEIVDAAYRCLAWKYHPDLNKSPDAAERMKAINQAYEILGDRFKRAEYDEARFGEAKPTRGQSGAESSGITPPPFACEECGRIDETLRATVFHYVVSLVVVSFQRSGGGILCRTCRIKDSLIHSLISLVLGPWGFPWGPLWAVRAFLTDVRGGHQPREINGPLLNLLGRYFLTINRRQQAIGAFEASLRYQHNVDVQETLARTRREWRAEQERARAAPPREQPRVKPAALLASPTRAEKSRWLSFAELRWVILGALITYSLGLVVLIVVIQSTRDSQASLAAPAEPGPTLVAAPAFVGTTPVSPTAAPTLTSPSTRTAAAPPTAAGLLANVTPLAAQQVKICATVANVRAGPGTNYPITRRLTDDWSVFVFGVTGEWYYVGADDRAGDQFMHLSCFCDKPPESPAAGPLAPGLRFAPIAAPARNPAPVASCANYQFVCVSSVCSNRYTDKPPLRAIQRPRGGKVYYDRNNAEYWDPNELGASEYFNCPAEAEAHGYVAAHPK